jgi:hypothetical protein
LRAEFAVSMICNLVAIAPNQLARLLREPARVLNVFFPDEGEVPIARDRLDLDKMWHGLHYVLTGTAWAGDPPFSLTILGGTEIGEDTGYGPPRYLTPEEVRAVADALNGTRHDVFLARFDPNAMNEAEVYSGGWEDCHRQHMGQYLAHLAGFYERAAETGSAVLICLS